MGRGIDHGGLSRSLSPQTGDAVFVAAGARKSSQELLGAARLEIDRCGGLIDENA